MRNKLVFKLIDPTIKDWEKYIYLEENLITLCQTFGVRVFDHSSYETNFTKTVYVEFKESKNIINCIFQIGLYLDAENLKFELAERSEIDKDFKKIANLPLVKIKKLIDQLNEGIDKLQEIG